MMRRITLGKVSSNYVGKAPGGMVSCRASMEARAIRTDTGEILAAEDTQKSGIDITSKSAERQAIKKAGDEIGASLVKQILVKWNSEVTNLTGVQMVITGLDYSQFIRFKRKLVSSIRGIKGVHERSFAGGRAVVDVDLEGNAQSLSEELVTRNLSPFKVDVTEFTANRLSVTVKRTR